MKNKGIVFLCVAFLVGIFISFPLVSGNEKGEHRADHDEISRIPRELSEHLDHEEHGDHDEHDEEIHDDRDMHEKHDEHDNHEADHEDEAEEGDDHEEGELELTDEQKKSIGIELKPVSSGKLHTELTLTGVLMLNEDAVAHIIPRVNGVAVAVNYTVGDRVKKSDVLAVLESAELGESFAEYMVSRKTYERKRQLYEEKIASQNDYLEALNRFEQVTADLYIKLGKEKYFAAAKMYEARYAPKTKKQTEALPLADSLAYVENTTRYEITAPISGTVIEKHITRGEKIGDDTNVYTIADLGTVWVNLKVPARDIGLIHPGMGVVVESHDSIKVEGKVSMVSPIVDIETRAATVRVIIDNTNGEWMPGAFVTGAIRISDKNMPLVIPRSAVQNFEGRDIVFLADDHGYRQVPVVTGRHDRENVEILSGLNSGQHIVTQGAFELKAILLTSGMDSHAGHGH
ncbi:MAG: efflux RND transporter periplasmic adaptor subunit [Desulfobulbaceae bacterium]|nr:efflux RND transporter periplasmic adaptor subunit [Desulfobulbaceae bacterium]